MCMIAFRPAGKGNIPSSVIDTAMTRHSDGFGVAYREAGDLVTEKFGPAERKAFRKALKRIDRSGGEYVAHFRWATHGPKDVHHAHPYEYEDPDPSVGRVLVFHNGVIGIHTEASESDTQVFVRDVLAALPSRWWESPAMRYLVNEAIDYSKLVLMTADETVNLHEKRGDWDGGLWYSSDHKPSKWANSGKGNTSTGYVPSTRYPMRDYGHWDNDRQQWIEADGTVYVPEPRTGIAMTSSGVHAAAIVPYKGTARTAAAALGLIGTVEHNDGCDTDRDVDLAMSFRHAGHTLTAIKTITLDRDADYEDAVICDECFTVGTVYVIDGTYYVDMAHNGPTYEDDDGEGLIQAVVARA